MAEPVRYSSNHLTAFLAFSFLNELCSSNLAAVVCPVIFMIVHDSAAILAYVVHVGDSPAHNCVGRLSA
jgi:hypothetical protein